MSNMNLLNDKISKKTYENVLKFRMTGRHFYILKIARPGKEQYVMTSKQRHLLPIKDEFFVDCGAFTGDTLLNYLKGGGTFVKYYAFEPNKKNIEIGKNVFSMPGVELFPYATGNMDGSVFLNRQKNLLV